jgi:hypothetical protein
MDEREFVTLTLERGEAECEILGVFNAGSGNDERQYVAVLPAGDSQIIIFRCYEVEAGFAEFENIDDDAEYETAAAEFGKILK